MEPGSDDGQIQDLEGDVSVDREEADRRVQMRQQLCRHRTDSRRVTYKNFWQHPILGKLLNSGIRILFKVRKSE